MTTAQQSFEASVTRPRYVVEAIWWDSRDQWMYAVLDTVTDQYVSGFYHHAPSCQGNADDRNQGGGFDT